MADTPDPTSGFITVGVCTWDLVVGDDFVIPIDDVEAAIGAEVGGDGAEPLVLGKHEVVLLFILVLVFVIGVDVDDLQATCDRVNKDKDITGVTEAKRAVFVFNEGKTTESGASHLAAFE